MSPVCPRLPPSCCMAANRRWGPFADSCGAAKRRWFDHLVDDGEEPRRQVEGVDHLLAALLMIAPNPRRSNSSGGSDPSTGSSVRFAIIHRRLLRSSSHLFPPAGWRREPSGAPFLGSSS